MGLGYGSVVEGLPSICKALGLIPMPLKEKNQYDQLMVTLLFSELYKHRERSLGPKTSSVIMV